MLALANLLYFVSLQHRKFSPSIPNMEEIRLVSVMVSSAQPVVHFPTRQPEPAGFMVIAYQRRILEIYLGEEIGDTRRRRTLEIYLGEEIRDTQREERI